MNNNHTPSTWNHGLDSKWPVTPSKTPQENFKRYINWNHIQQLKQPFLRYTSETLHETSDKSEELLSSNWTEYSSNYASWHIVKASSEMKWNEPHNLYPALVKKQSSRDKESSTLSGLPNTVFTFFKSRGTFSVTKQGYPISPGGKGDKLTKWSHCYYI